jgi:hypothetical protein
MLQDISTVDTSEQPTYYSTPNSSQVEREQPIRPLFTESFLIPASWYELVVSVNLDLQIPDIARNTDPIASRLFGAESIHSNVSYRNSEAVRAYLATYPEIEDFLKETLPVLFRCFGGPVNVVLEVVTYPENGAYDELVGWIQSTDDVSEGLEKLDRFGDEWFPEQLSRVGNRFSFNIEFK